MGMSGYQILLYYKYINIDNPKQFLKKQRTLCELLNLKGRIIIAKEGLNGTVEGETENTEKYIEYLKSDARFSDIHMKRSVGTGNAFPKLSIKLRDEIVSSRLDNENISINPQKITGKYITPEELNDWIHKGKKFYFVDMRNIYETAIGHFENSIKAPFENFRDLAKVLPVLENLKNETIVTVCTGGVRCEKASGFLVANGFSDVYQLFGGIVSYMEKYPNEDFLGKLYVFDGRLTMGFNIDDPKHKIIGKCAVCQKPADIYRDCKNAHCQNLRHFVACVSCFEKNMEYCSVCSKKVNF